MSETEDYYSSLILRQAWKEALTEEGQEALQRWREQSVYHDAVADKFKDIRWVGAELYKREAFPAEKVWQLILERIEAGEPGEIPASRRRLNLFKIFHVAMAAFLVYVLVRAVLFFIYHKPSPSLPSPVQQEVSRSHTRQQQPDLSKPEVLTVPVAAPKAHPVVHRGVLLKKGNGKMICLDTLRVGKHFFADGAVITRISNTRLLYMAAVSDKAGGVKQHQIITREAGPYTIVFTDGSEATLNYASSLQFPAVFRGKDRRVELKGEASFTITKNDSIPFIVKTRDAQVDVLGTTFNIMSYADEHDARVTVLSGAVSVRRRADTAIILRPSQQAIIGEKGVVVLTLSQADCEGVISWRSKIPTFSFRNDDLNTALLKVARRYHLTVSNPDHIKGKPITSNPELSLPVKKILEAIAMGERGEATIKLKGNTIIVTAKK